MAVVNQILSVGDEQAILELVQKTKKSPSIPPKSCATIVVKFFRSIIRVEVQSVKNYPMVP